MARRAQAVPGQHDYDRLATMRWLSSSLLSLFSSEFAIDLGTANPLVFCKGRGIVVREPSIVAVNQKTGRVEAVGVRPGNPPQACLRESRAAAADHRPPALRQASSPEEGRRQALILGFDFQPSSNS